MNEINAISIAALEKRVVALESMVATSLNRIETLIRQQIQDLKSEHISEIRKSVDRMTDEIKIEEEHCSIDRQRMWDRLRELETAESRRSGISSVWIGISHLVAAAAGGLIAAAAAWVSSGRPPPHL